MKISIQSLNKPGITDFAEERNVLLRKAKSEWVIFIDTDEKMSKDLELELKNLEPADYSGFYIMRKNYFLGRYVGRDKILRLARKSAGKWRRRVHEVWEVKGRIGQLKNPLIHNTGDNLHGFIEKLNRYSTLHAEENLKEGKPSSLIKIIFYPKAKFVTSIFSGREFVFSILQAFHSFLAWSKQWELQKD